MSHSGKPESEKGVDKISDRLKKSLSCDGDNTDKPDFREIDLGSASPISPLQAGSSASTSSSSSGSVSDRTGNVPQAGSGSGSGSSSSSGARKSGSGGNTKKHSVQFSADSSPTSSGRGSRGVKSAHARSEGGGTTSSGRSSATSPSVKIRPTGNLFPSGIVVTTGMNTPRSPKSDVLGFGTANYGHGSIMRGRSGSGNPNSPISKRSSIDPEELKKIGNDEYKKGHFLEALDFYDRSIALSPASAPCHCNRAAALIGLKRLTEAIKACEEAIKLDSNYVRAHHRLGSILISLGQVENGRKYLSFPGQQPDPRAIQKLQDVEKHVSKCSDCRRVRDWVGVLRESDAAILSGADACPQLYACKAEALLKLRQLDDADSILSNLPKFDASGMIFGMLSEAYLLFVRAQIDMSFGRFENAVALIEKLGQMEPKNVEVAVLIQNVRSLTGARARGNDLFKSYRLTEASSAYGEGLRIDPSNPILYCNRAACWFKLGLYERCLDDCNQALIIHPSYTKARLRRAVTCSKLERWAESVRDYEVLRRELPNNNEIAESLFHAQVALKKSRGEEVHNMKFGGEVELITSLDQFKAAITSTGACVVLFKTTYDAQCKQMCPFLDTLCTRYPFVNFLMVDIEESPTIASAESVRIVPTVKIYKNGNRVKEMVCPSLEVLESSVRHYSF